MSLRKPKTSSLIPAFVYHAIATLIVFTLYYLAGLSPVTALAFGLVLLKFSIIALNREWYRTAQIQYVAMLETGTALSFLVIVAFSLLPARLTP